MTVDKVSYGVSRSKNGPTSANMNPYGILDATGPPEPSTQQIYNAFGGTLGVSNNCMNRLMNCINQFLSGDCHHNFGE